MAAPNTDEVDSIANFRPMSRYISKAAQKKNVIIKQLYWSWHVAQYKLEMWANAQRDGRPAKRRWRPLFNAAKFGW